MIGNLKDIKLGDRISKGQYEILTVEYLENGLMYACARDDKGKLNCGLSYGIIPVKILEELGWTIKVS